jgi:tetratricopeptide (TPR) repeat protein
VKASERHRLKHDKYAESVVEGLAWAQRHQNLIAVVIVAVLVIFGGTLYLKWTRQTSRNSAADILADVEAQGQRALLEDPEKRPDEVSQVLSRYDSLASSYPETSSARVGLVQAGDLLVKSGRPADAISYYDRAMAAAGKGPIAGLARRGKAVALEASGDYRKAIEHYSYFADDSTTLEGVQANWNIGRCYELLGETDQARAYYEKAAQYGEDSDWAELARFRLSELARGVAPAIQPEPRADEAAPVPPVAEPGGGVSVEPNESAPQASPEAPTEAPAEEAQPAGTPESAPDTVEPPAAP